MKQGVVGKIAVLAVTLVLFSGGVFALSLERGLLRTTLLVVVLAGMLAIAVGQTLVRLKKKN